MRLELHLTATTALLCLATGAAAQSGAPPADLADQTAIIEDVIVTANRSPQAADRVGQSVTVLTRRDIDATQTVAVVDLLTRTPGVSLSRNGGIGSATSLRIRGAESDQTVVVIDGVKLNDPSAVGGGYNFGELLVGDIGRIEVLRGAQSTLWGSQAIGGVVNLISVRPSRPLQADLTAEAGSRGTRYLRGGVGVATDRLTLRVAGSRFSSDGFSAFVNGTEPDGYSNTGLSGRAEIRLAEGVSVDLRTVYSEGVTDFDGFPAPQFVFADTREFSRTRDLVGYAGLNFGLFGGRLTNRVAYGHTRTDRRNFNPDQTVTDVTFDADGENRRFEYQGVVEIRPGWTATFGAEHEESQFSSTSPNSAMPAPTPTGAEVGITGAYAQLQAAVATGLTLTAGLRRDDHETFGGKLLGQAAAAWSLNDGATIVRASFGEGFKAPSLFQLYSAFGNRGLEPEQADGYDLGVEQSLFDRRVRLSLTGFRRDTTDQIDFVSCAATSTEPLCVVNGVRRFGYYENLAQTRAEGLEAELGATFGALEFEANYTLTETENRSPGANLGRRLPRRPREQANLTIGYSWPFGLSTGVAVRHTGESFDNASNSARLDAYTLVDLRASYPLTEALELYGRIENIGDVRYQTVRDYGSAGQGTFVGVRARF